MPTLEGTLLSGEPLREPFWVAVHKVMSLSGPLANVANSITSIWKEFTGAEALRLWILNPTFSELALLVAKAEGPITAPLDKTRNRLGAKSLGMHCMGTMTVLRVDHPSQTVPWEPDPNLSDLLESLPTIICVPIVSVDALPSDHTTPRFRGVIDLHVRTLTTISATDWELTLLGRFTAAALLRGLSFDRSTATSRLNALALALVNPWSIGTPLRDQKARYLSGLIAIIQDVIHVNCVSVFEADESREVLRCVATTGIDLHPTPERTVTYRDGKFLTWTVFASGRSTNLPHHAGNTEFRETRTLPIEPNRDSILIVPLPGQDSNTATGVIRVRERRCNHYADRTQSFSQADEDILNEVAAHASPILQMIRLQDHRETFVQRTAHQVNQPLQGVVAYSSNLLDGLYDLEPEKKAQKLRYIRQMARAAAGMMRSSVWLSGVTDFSHLPTLKREARKVAEFFIERLIDLQPIRANDQVRLKFIDEEKADGLGTFLVDGVFFEQAIQNVLHNAVKYSYRATTINVWVERHARALAVYVTSTGVPIPVGERDKIFWDRERGHVATHYDPTGTGQGLFIARRIMRGFGGDLTLESSEPAFGVKAPKRFPPATRTTFKLHYPGAFPS